jgi:hypothetical protein
MAFVPFMRQAEICTLLAHSIRSEEGGQAAARADRKGLAPVIARRQRQITTAGSVLVGLWRLRVSPGQSGPAAWVPSCLTRARHRPVM